jgi:glucose/arabinose dehydrogenase
MEGPGRGRRLGRLRFRSPLIALTITGVLLVVVSSCRPSASPPAGALPGGVSAELAAPAAEPPQQSTTEFTFNPSLLKVSVELVTGGVREPTHVASASDGSGRLFIVERAGRILIVRDGRVLPRPFLDIQSRVGSRFDEQGLLSVAFHPRFAENGYFFVNFTDRNGDTTIERYAVSRDPDVADPGSHALILAIPQPAPNHNGGLLLFGPDGYLYVGMGDGGGAGDQFRNAQNTRTLLGKMLRIDVDAAFPYGIPPDNPLVGRGEARSEIWAYGLRNPWRYSFDRATGELYIADVGQFAIEEVHLQPTGRGGQNYGWPIMEGSQCYPERRTCDTSGLEIPIAQYDHALGCAITGGYVYRGVAYPLARGAYFFADFCSGRIWSLHRGADGAWQQTQMLDTSLSISSFGEDDAGELYVVSLEQGGLYRLVLGPAS